MTAADPLDEDEVTLITTGRRTGRPHEVTLWFAGDGDAIWLRGDRGADWLRNLEHDPRCRLRVGSTVLDGVRERVADEGSALRHVVTLLRAKYGAEWVADWYVDHGRVPVRIALGRAVRP